MSCTGVGARPRDWIEAQFAMFEGYTKWVGKRLIPQPAQLHGLNAQARYLQWKTDDVAERHRDKKKEKSIRDTFSIDERNLKALCKTLRLPETDVLMEKYNEFTRNFLKHKGIYTLVEEKYEQERAS